MTTTPAPLDLDALKALLDAMPEGPWRVALSQPSPGIRTAAGWEVVHASYDDHLSVLEFIAAARNALPALLDELATERRQGASIASFADGAIRQIGEERDAAREELAKTRAELDEIKVKGSPGVMHEVDRAFYDLTIKERDAARAELDAMTERRNEVRELAAKREAELIYLRAEVTTWKRKAVRLREELGNAKARISAAATVEVWTNEDGKRFVFADDLMRALDTNPEASPATTAEPAQVCVHTHCQLDQHETVNVAEATAPITVTHGGLVPAPDTTAEPAHTVWDHYGPCGYCGATTGPCLNVDNSDWPTERMVPAPKPHPRRQLADATAEPADEPKATCHLPVQNGEPCGLLICRKHGCRVAPKAEPAAS